MPDTGRDMLTLSFCMELCSMMPVGMAIFDSDLVCVFANEFVKRLMRAGPGVIEGRRLTEFVPGIEKTERYKYYLDTLKTGQPHTATFSVNVFDGSGDEIFCNAKSSRINDFLVIIIEDITAEKLLESRQNILLNALMDNLSAYVFIKSSNFIYTAVNKTCASFFDLTPEGMIGKSSYDLFASDIAEKIRKEDEAVLSGQIIENKETHLISLTGEAMWASITKVPLRENGKIIGLLGIAFDITERKIVEAEVDLIITTMHQTSETIVITDRDGVIQYVNPAFEKITGYSMDEAIGQKPSVLKSGKHDPALYDDLWNTITSGKSWHGHFINKRKDGSLYEEDAAISPIKNEQGEIVNFVAVKKDVTNERKLEDQLRQSQKMAAIGRLAGGIAHDFNNILTVIIGYSELMMRSVDDGSSLHAQLNEIHNAGKRASDLTAKMLAFSKKQVIERKQLHCNKLIESMAEMLKRIVGENIKFKLKLCGDDDIIYAEASQVEQILLNLVVNAKDAINGKSGVITICTETVSLDQKFEDGNFSAPPGAYFRMAVRDTGSGISSSVLPHIFEPFFTDKQGTAGTGLGLATVYGIIKQHDGFIKVEAEPGKGAVFYVYFPVEFSNIFSPEEETVEDGENVSGCSGTVLLVEDEKPVLEYAASILKLAGTSVITAADADEAVKKFDAEEGSIDLLVTDIVLTGISGNELAEKLVKKKPDLRVLFMSGYSGQAFNGIRKHLDEFDFIAKPFTMESFIRKVCDCLKKGG